VLRVTSTNEVTEALEFLFDTYNPKLQKATHNMYAYRIASKDGIGVIQDNDDDGETAAGGRLAHLLQILDVTDVLVVVSRWYGGVKLGSDRFKHINNAARSALINAKLLTDTKSNRK